jgi:hypothetical protein
MVNGELVYARFSIYPYIKKCFIHRLSVETMALPCLAAMLKQFSKYFPTITTSRQRDKAVLLSLQRDAAFLIRNF